MLLTPADLSTFSRLLGVALDLPPTEWGAWFGSITSEHRHLIPQLQEMLAEHLTPDHPGFMADGPRLGSEANDVPAAQPGDRVGPYRLLREIGRGGMSSVWLAERPDGIVKRNVALKMPLLTLTSASQVERFERERDVLALLAHPQIARLYDAGVTPSGQPFFVLEYVDGLPITAACDARQSSVPERLRIFLGVLAAVDHAHKHLVVHRDIKPSNVFVDAEGNVKLLDFGIAKLLTDPLGTSIPSALTRDAGCALTPSYAAPEQMTGQPISTATDVYSLGVLLYELLTGVLPHGDAQGSMAQAVNATLRDEPPHPSVSTIDAAAAARRGGSTPERLRSLLAGDLDTIVLKALRNEPANRYGSVERFADDLRCVLESRPIAARPPSLAYRLRLLLRRHRSVAIASTAGCVVAIVFAGLLGQQFSLTAAQEARANAVREFMLDMVEDADPDESHPGSEITGKQMVEGGLRRAHDRFRDQPQLLGQVLGELGRMFQHFGEDEKARAVLAESVSLLVAHAPLDDPALNKSRVSTAELAFAANEPARARALAQTAHDACRRQDKDCAKARAYASALLAQLDIRSGQLQAALVNIRESVDDMARGFGPQHAETATAWHGLAVTARNAGEFQEADQAIRIAQSIAGRAVLRARERIMFARTQALIEADLGRYEAARDILRDLIARTHEPSERALQWRASANAELALGQGAAALTAANNALALATTASGKAEAAYAHQAHARAQGLLGNTDPALAEMREVLTALAAAGYAPHAPPLLRTRRHLGEMLARSGELDAAWAQIEPVVQLLAGATGGMRVELGMALDLQGCIQRARGRLAEAAALHERARSLLIQQLPAEHPALARNALYHALAKTLANDTPEARARYLQLAAAYGQRFGPTSTWSQLIAAQRDPAACVSRTPRTCMLIL